MAIIIPIGVDTRGLRRLDTAGARLRKFGKIAAVAAGAAAFGGLVKTLDVGVKKFIEQDKAIRQTNARLKSTGGIAGVTADELVKLSDAIADKTGIDDDAIHAMGNMLLTFTNIRNEVGKNNDIFDQAVQITTDLSVAFEKDLQTSAIMVGKALNDPIKGVTALGRAGVQFTEQQKDQIKTLVESGKTLEAQKMILRELEMQVGGSADAFGKTLPGQLSILRQAFDNVALGLASRFVPKIFAATRSVTNFLNEFKARPTLEAKIRFTIGTFAGVIWRSIQTVSDWWQKRKVVFEDNPANRLKVNITPSGREQFETALDTMVTRLRGAANEAGQKIGREIAKGFFGGFTIQTNRGKSSLIEKIIKLYRGDYILEIGVELAKGIWEGFTGYMEEIGATWPEFFSRILKFDISFLGRGLGETFGSAFNRGAKDKAQSRRGGFVAITNQIVLDAIAGARESLAGLGSTVTSFLNQLVGSNSPQARELAQIRQQQEEQRKEREETELRARLAAAETAEERAQAQRELDDWLLEEDARRLEREIADEQAANETKVNNLIERFNQGLLSADEFNTQLQSILGPDTGLELGEAFAGGFQRAIDSLKNTIQSIFTFAGTQAPLTAAAGPDLKGQAKEQYEADLADWRRRRDARKQQATDFRKREASDEGEKITKAEREQINNIMKAWDKKNPRPKKSAYGLAMGGILKSTVFAAGEMGPEAVIPLDSQSAWNMLRDAASGTGGGGQTVINLTVNAGLGTNPDELSRVIVDSIKRYERRNGQVFSGPLVTATTTASGVATTASGATDFNRISARRRG
jgi:hypothetical protein